MSRKSLLDCSDSGAIWADVTQEEHCKCIVFGEAVIIQGCPSNDSRCSFYQTNFALGFIRLII